MKKICFPFLLLLFLVNKSNAQTFNQSVELKSCSIDVKANPFTAVTFIELEFYNPQDKEVEAFQQFELSEGAVITNFQLELNGKYRNGSIDEKGKATNAYNRIVGKRIDPALLSQQYDNHYSLNIFPVPAHGSRKVTITILQLMKDEKSKISYSLPLNFSSNTTKLKLNINVTGIKDAPQTNTGLIESTLFNLVSDVATMNMNSENVKLNKPISFSILLKQGDAYSCLNKDGNFLLRVMPDIEKNYKIKPKHITVLWDMSKSANKRSIEREINFLYNYVTVNKIGQVDFIAFNHSIKDKLSFSLYKNNFYDLYNHIRSIKYGGATMYGQLDFSTYKTDAILFFSDGQNSAGDKLPNAGAVQVNCIYSSFQSNTTCLNNIIGNSGGNLINLTYKDQIIWIDKLSSAENFLMRVSAASSISLQNQLPSKVEISTLLKGQIASSNNEIKLLYGNNASINKTSVYSLNNSATCNEETYNQVQLLHAVDSIKKYYWNWNDIVIFGIRNRVVTQYTSYLVLERVEDYIKYNIAPPDDLVEKCAELNYVYKSEFKIKAVNESTESDKLATVVNDYNNRIKRWDKGEAIIDLTKTTVIQNENAEVEDKKTITTSANSAMVSAAPILNKGDGLTEVVVTSAVGIKKTQRSQTSNVQNVTAAQLNTIRQPSINNALAGKVAGLQVRSQSMAVLGRSSIVRLRGENGFFVGAGPIYVVDGTIIPDANDINIDDVEDVTVLQGPSSAALFGPDGANGAIVVNTKRAKKNYSKPVWSSYKLSKQEDVEYMEEMNKAEPYERIEMFEKLEEEYETTCVFYFDMAQYFFEKGYKQKAYDLLMDAIETGSGNVNSLTIAGYILEQWKQYDEAIIIYKNVLNIDTQNVMIKRNMAFAYIGLKNYQAAVDILYSAITAPDTYYNRGVKELALADLNAIITIYKDKINLSAINSNLIKPLPVDIRITVEGCYTGAMNMSITEPENISCNENSPATKNGGSITHGVNGYNYYSYYNTLCKEYTIKNAVKGKYKIHLDSYNYNTYNSYTNMVRVMKFKNFQKENQSIETEIICLDNQYGKVEISELEW